MSNKKILNIRLRDFKVAESSFNSHPEIRITKRNKPHLSFNASFSTELSEDIILIILKVRLGVTHKKNTLELGRLETGTFFEVEDLKKIFESDIPKFPPGLLENLIGISISTTRGAFATLAKISGIPRHLTTLPLINPKNLLPKEWANQGE